jgi:hypothetical protein
MDTRAPGAGPATPDMQSSSWLPRDSVKARVQCEDGFDLSHLLPRDARAKPTWFADTLAGETRRVLASLAEELRHLALPGLDHVEVELDDSNWRISGSAVPADGHPRLSLSLGFALAVEEATLEFLSWEDALCPIQALRDRDPGEERASAVERYAYDEDDRPGRFATYHHLRDTEVVADDVTSGFPANPWRLRQQELLSALIIRWAALHEIAHGALCHLDLIQAFFGSEGAELGLLEDGPLSGEEADREAWKRFGYPEPPVPATREADVRQILELHADTCASWLAFDLDRISRESGDGLFEAYQRDMAALGTDPAAQFVALSPDNRVHFLLLAGLIAILLFEFARRSSGRDGGETHPLPEARLIAMIRESFYGSALAEADGDGGFRIVVPSGDLYPEGRSSAWNRFIQDGPARAMEDMEFFSTVLEMDIALFGPEAGDAPDVPIEYHEDGYLKGVPGLDQSRMSRWWQDVLGRGELVAASLRGEDAAVVPLSEGGKQLRSLDVYQLHINRISELLQRRGGRPALAFLLTERDSAAGAKRG